MKFSTGLLTATATAIVGVAAAPAAHATLLATFYGGYASSDQALGAVVNNTGLTETNVTLSIDGFSSTSFGTVGPLGSAGYNGLGDADDYCYCNVTGSVTIGGKSYSATVSFPSYPWDDYYGASGVPILTVSGVVPEPATIAVLGTALLGLGAVRRRKSNKA
jgi:PEP-CTERM motif